MSASSSSAGSRKPRKPLTAEQKARARARASKNRRQRADSRFEASWLAPMPPESIARRQAWRAEVTKGGRAYYAHHILPEGGLPIRGMAGLYAHPEKIRRRFTAHYNPEYHQMVIEPTYTKGGHGRTAPPGRRHVGFTNTELRHQIAEAKKLGYKPKYTAQTETELDRQASYARSKYRV